MKIDVGNGQWVDLDRAISILPKEPETNSVKGSFDFKSETVITMDNGDVIRTTVPIPDLMSEHEKAVKEAELKQVVDIRPVVAGADDIVKVLEAAVKELEVIRKEFGFLREIANRFGIVVEEHLKHG